GDRLFYDSRTPKDNTRVDKERDQCRNFGMRPRSDDHPDQIPGACERKEREVKGGDPIVIPRHQAYSADPFYHEQGPALVVLHRQPQGMVLPSSPQEAQVLHGFLLSRLSELDSIPEETEGVTLGIIIGVHQSHAYAGGEFVRKDGPVKSFNAGALLFIKEPNEGSQQEDRKYLYSEHQLPGLTNIAPMVQFRQRLW